MLYHTEWQKDDRKEWQKEIHKLLRIAFHQIIQIVWHCNVCNSKKKPTKHFKGGNSNC